MRKLTKAGLIKKLDKLVKEIVFARDNHCVTCPLWKEIKPNGMKLPPDMKERKSETRRALLLRDGPGCQAEKHESNCSCRGCPGRRCQTCKNINIDHITPKAVGRELGWSHAQIERLSNKEMLSLECHRVKDMPTPDAAHELRQQKKGRFIGIGKHAGIIYE